MKRGALPTLSHRETNRFAAVFAANGLETRPLRLPLRGLNLGSPEPRCLLERSSSKEKSGLLQDGRDEGGQGNRFFRYENLIISLLQVDFRKDLRSSHISQQVVYTG